MKRTLLYPKNEIGKYGRLFGSAPREFHPHAVLARPYLLPATPRRLITVARSDCSCKGVSLSCWELSPASCHTCFTSLCFSLAPWGGPGAPFARLVTNRSYPSALYCREFSASAFFVNEPGNIRGKGLLVCASGLYISLKPRIEIISFVSRRLRSSSST